MIKFFLILMLVAFIALMFWLAWSSGNLLGWPGWKWGGLPINWAIAGAIGWYARGQHERGKALRGHERPQ
jgi:hypothetical protein